MTATISIPALMEACKKAREVLSTPGGGKWQVIHGASAPHSERWPLVCVRTIGRDMVLDAWDAYNTVARVKIGTVTTGAGDWQAVVPVRLLRAMRMLDKSAVVWTLCNYGLTSHAELSPQRRLTALTLESQHAWLTREAVGIKLAAMAAAAPAPHAVQVAPPVAQPEPVQQPAPRRKARKSKPTPRAAQPRTRHNWRPFVRHATRHIITRTHWPSMAYHGIAATA